MAKKSYKAAVEDMCKACIYDPNADGAWRQQVEACTSRTCPLFDVRPLSSNTIARKRAARAKERDS